MNEILNLGFQYLSDFRKDLNLPEKFPLVLLVCAECSLVQLSETVNRNLMYHDGYGYRSGVNEQIRANLKKIVEIALSYKAEPKSWLDIACNDGTLLSLTPSGVQRVGVDPVKKFKAESQNHADYIIDDFFPTPQLGQGQTFDIITSVSMFYDLDDPNEFVSAVRKILHKDSIWIVQQNYLISMIRNLSFDNVCHEHIEYYSVTAMNNLLVNHGLEIIEVMEDPINGGSIITIIAPAGIRKIHDSVGQYLHMENDFGVKDANSYKEFAREVDSISTELGALINSLVLEGKRIYIYGASTRGAVIWQKVGLGPQQIPFAVERQAEKVGRIFSAISVPIISEDEMRLNPPDYLLVGPWFLRESFLSREQDYLLGGGKMIFPLPRVEIIQS
jgi:hypothetical protein